MTTATPAEATRERIVAVTARLLAEGGRDAVSTRAVSAAAGVQAPTLYRLFGDKRGLLDAAATHGFLSYLEGKVRRVPTDDPVADLRAGWDLHIGFGLANPAVFALMYGDPGPGAEPPASLAAAEVLAAHVHRIAVAGRLRVPEQRAVQLIHAVGTGTTLTLIATPEAERDMAVSHLARDAALDAITTDAAAVADAGPAGAAVTLRAGLADIPGLTPGERGLLGEWLDRIAG